MKARRPVELRGHPGCIAYVPSMQPRAESCMENQPAARRGSTSGSPTLKAVLSAFWAIFHAGNSHFRANRGGAARREQPGVRGVARGGARAQRQLS